MKPRLLCILHTTPPVHGAGKVGDAVASSYKLKKTYDCRFINIKSSKTIGEIGKISFKKIYYTTELNLKIIWVLLTFRPQRIYYTVSVAGFAFYRDLITSIIIRCFALISPLKLYYHYHTQGVNDFVSFSKWNLKLTQYFLKDVNLIILDSSLAKDFELINTYKKIHFLPNGIEDTIDNMNWDSFIKSKFENFQNIEVLFMSNMIKSKGYFEIIKLANQTKINPKIKYNIAGGWVNDEGEKEFFDYLNNNQLTNSVTYYGHVEGDLKQKLFKKAHLFILPTSNKNESFPLVILEALSYGLPVIASNIGAMISILDKKSGILLENIFDLERSIRYCHIKIYKSADNTVL